jgi:hypothetical protein
MEERERQQARQIAATLGSLEALLYLEIAAEDGGSTATAAELGRWYGRTGRQVQRCLQALEAAGYIESSAAGRGRARRANYDKNVVYQPSIYDKNVVGDAGKYDKNVVGDAGKYDKNVVVQAGKYDKNVVFQPATNNEDNISLNKRDRNSLRTLERDSLSLTLSPEEIPGQLQCPGPVVTLKGWDAFWNAYPRKDDELAAQYAWVSLNIGAELEAEIMAGLAQQKASRQWQQEGGRYIPKAVNWLRGKRWRERLPTAAQQAPEQRGSARNCPVDRPEPSGNNFLATAADRPRRLKRKEQ